MIAKKSSSADLEKKRFAFFQIGLIVSGALCLVAFEYSSATIDGKTAMVEEEVQETYYFDEKLHDIVEQPQQKQNTATVTMIPIDNVTVTSTAVQTGTFSSHTISVIGDGGYGDLGELEPEDIIYEGVDQEPQFPGGAKAMNDFITGKTIYPQLPREMGIEGTVYIEFVVSENGSISQVVSKNTLNAQLEKEAMRVVGLMPNWIPGEQAGKPVKVRYVVPINFVLQH